MTGIEWTGKTWNPATGCDPVSPGCDHCYALRDAARLKRMGQAKYQADGDPRTSGPGFGVTIHPETLTIPLGWRKPRRIFVNSMSDLSGGVTILVTPSPQLRQGIYAGLCARQLSRTRVAWRSGPAGPVSLDLGSAAD